MCEITLIWGLPFTTALLFAIAVLTALVLLMWTNFYEDRKAAITAPEFIAMFAAILAMGLVGVTWFIYHPV